MLTRVFVDANVLASRTLRDWIFQIRLKVEMFQLHASEDVVVETQRVWRRRNPAADGRWTTDLRQLLTQYLDEVLLDFPGDVPFGGADEHDRHVHAAAVFSRADILLTENIDDFADATDLPYDLYRPDEFLCLVDDGAPEVVRQVTRDQNAYWQGQAAAGKSCKPLATALIDAGCPTFAERVTTHLRVLSGL